MYFIKDFQKQWFRYKTDGESIGQSIERYCKKMGVPYKQFEKWYCSSCKDIIPIKIEGVPETNPIRSDYPVNVTSCQSRHKSVPENRILVIV